MFLPKKSKFFDELAKQSSIMEEAAQTFKEITHHWQGLKRGWLKLERLEKEGDQFVHSITDEIEKTFILPLDKEDIKEITECLDDVVDGFEQTANRLNIYKVGGSKKELKEFAKILLEATQEVHKGILMIKEQRLSQEEFTLCYRGLHTIESEGDKLHRKVLAKMMGGESPDFNKDGPLSILKWKEIFQTLEDTLDICEHMAIVFSRLKLKYT